MLRLATLIGLTALTACTDDFQGDPQLSDIRVDQQTFPEASVRVPMPRPAVVPVGTRADKASLWHNDEGGFFGDQRAASVGDLLTVRIDIDDAARLNNASERSQSGQNSVDLPAFFGLGSTVQSILPDPDDQDDLVRLKSGSESEGEGSIKRSERVSLKVAALIIEELPNGNLVVAGRQEVKVNAELRELRVSGIIRPVDIADDNSITYEKIAEARISYGGRGQLSQVQTPRYGQRALDVVLPY